MTWERGLALLPLASPIAHLYLLDPGGIFLGSMHHHVGVLATAAGDSDQARSHFADAVSAHRRIGANLWLTRSEHELLVTEPRNIRR